MFRKLTAITLLALVIFPGLVYKLTTRKAASEIFQQKTIAALRDYTNEKTPVGYTKQALQQLFDNVLAGVKSGDIDKGRLQKFNHDFAASISDGHVDSLEITILLHDLENINSKRP